MDYYNSKGSTVYTATLDISKAFDMINHYKLFDSLIKAGIPGWIIDILVNWYSKLTVKVKLDGMVIYLIAFFYSSKWSVARQLPITFFI